MQYHATFHYFILLLLAAAPACSTPGRGTGVLHLPDADAPGFTAVERNGRLWIFREGEPQVMSGQHVTMIGAGPNGETVRAADRKTALEYLSSAPGFQVEVEDGAVWVWRTGTPFGQFNRYVTRLGSGPWSRTYRALDSETLDDYFASVQERRSVQMTAGAPAAWQAVPAAPRAPAAMPAPPASRAPAAPRSQLPPGIREVRPGDRN